VVGVGTWDQVVIASSHLALKKTGCWLPGARYLVRSGPDGTDLALLDLADHERIAERFAQVTIASGDGTFAQAAASPATAGCRVTVVSLRAGLCRQLALAVGWRVIYIDRRTHPHQPPGRGRPHETTCPSTYHQGTSMGGAWQGRSRSEQLITRSAANPEVQASARDA
jgi:hypothetical protein